RELVNKAFRHVTLTFDRPVDPEPFGALPGVRDLKSDGERISFALHEPPDAVVKLAAKYRLVGLEYERPSLEEVFLTYYGEEGGGS
ncbi:MAG: DUF4162 domain-containing protein, partial [Actinomycetota bacterium]|nr:DUF4162 domain-containing protein [Actinomycetota bacterium]